MSKKRTGLVRKKKHPINVEFYMQSVASKHFFFYSFRSHYHFNFAVNVTQVL